MFNVKKAGGTFKGIIGECLFKLTNDSVIITKFFNKEKFFFYFSKYFTCEQESFLRKHWFSIDAIEVNGISNKAVIIYEIKTRNKYSKGLYFKPKMTENTSTIYSNAKSLRIEVQMVTVWLYQNWEYDVEIKEFDLDDFCIEKPKTYDWRAILLKK